MPIYEYECKACGTRFEKMQPITADPLTECANCGQGPVRRVLHPVGIIFKGSGWYVTDSRKGSNATPDGAAPGKDEKKSEDSSTLAGSEKEAGAAAKSEKSSDSTAG